MNAVQRGGDQTDAIFGSEKTKDTTSQVYTRKSIVTPLLVGWVMCWILLYSTPVPGQAQSSRCQEELRQACDMGTFGQLSLSKTDKVVILMRHAKNKRVYPFNVLLDDDSPLPPVCKALCRLKSCWVPDGVGDCPEQDLKVYYIEPEANLRNARPVITNRFSITAQAAAAGLLVTTRQSLERTCFMWDVVPNTVTVLPVYAASRTHDIERKREGCLGYLKLQKVALEKIASIIKGKSTPGTLSVIVASHQMMREVASRFLKTPPGDKQRSARAWEHWKKLIHRGALDTPSEYYYKHIWVIVLDATTNNVKSLKMIPLESAEGCESLACRAQCTKSNIRNYAADFFPAAPGRQRTPTECDVVGRPAANR